MARKITFTNVGIVKRSRVWRNQETGVEIIKGANFAEAGLYYVAVPSLGADGREVVTSGTVFADVRADAVRVATTLRDEITAAYTEALDENDTRDMLAANAGRTVRVEIDTRGMHLGLGHVAPATIEAARSEALAENGARNVLDEASRCGGAGVRSPRLDAYCVALAGDRNRYDLAAAHRYAIVNLYADALREDRLRVWPRTVLVRAPELDFDGRAYWRNSQTGIMVVRLRGAFTGSYFVLCPERDTAWRTPVSAELPNFGRARRAAAKAVAAYRDMVELAHTEALTMNYPAVVAPQLNR